MSELTKLEKEYARQYELEQIADAQTEFAIKQIENQLTQRGKEHGTNSAR